MFEVGKRFAFSASHALTAVPEGHKCRRLHGHNYEVEVVCAADRLDGRGMVVDYFDLDPVKGFLDDTVDHRHLNDVVPGEPTAERLAEWLYDQLELVLPESVAGKVVAIRVHETPKTWAEYRPTFQGEGPSMGRRAGFVRLGRCNLDCTWCDTPYTWDWSRFDPGVEVRKVGVAEVVEQLDAMGPEIVVVTGGEPLLQQRALLPLLEACAERGWPVEVETNGTLAPSPAVVPLVAQWNVSPKLANSGVAEERRVVPEALAALRATGRAVFKLVVGNEAELDEVAALVDAHDLAPVWIMPEGTDRAALLERARALADPVTARGWNLTTRLHVLLWGDERGR